MLVVACCLLNLASVCPSFCFVIEELINQMNHLDLTFDLLGDLISKGVGNYGFAFTAKHLTQCPANQDVLLRVYRKNWTNNGGLDLMLWIVVYLFSTLKKKKELKSILQKAPLSFHGGLLVLSKFLSSTSPSLIPFDLTPLWL